MPSTDNRSPSMTVEKKITEAMRRVLGELKAGTYLCECDEVTPPWWIESGHAVPSSTAKALLKRGLVVLSAHWGGQPGVNGFRITDSGRRLLSEGK